MPTDYYKIIAGPNVSLVKDPIAKTVQMSVPSLSNYALSSTLAKSISKRLTGKMDAIGSRNFQGSLFNSGTGTGFTYASILKAPATEFAFVRVLFRNIQTTPAQLQRVLCAVTNTATNTAQKITPSTGNTVTNDSATGWVEMKFGGVANPTLPAKGVGNDASFLVSDWAPVRSIPPVDGSNNLPYVMCRAKYSTQPFSYTISPAVNTDKTKDGYWETFSASGDGVTTPSGMTTAGSDQAIIIAGVQFMSGSRLLKVGAVGDSTVAGEGASVAHGDWLSLAADQLKAVGLPVNVINGGYNGATTAEYLAMGKRLVTTFTPDVCFYSPFSPNDGTITAAIADAQFMRALEFANFCAAINILTVFSFQAPVGVYTDPVVDGYRQALVTRCINSGIPVCNMLSVTQTISGGVGIWVPAYQFDSLHPNSAGYAAMSGVCAATISDICASNYLRA